MIEFRDYADLKAQSEADCKMILDAARQALAIETDNKDRDSLSRSVYFLEKGFRALSRISETSNEGKLVLEALCEVMGGAWLAGAGGAYTESMKKYFGKITHEKKLAVARAAKQPNDHARMQRLDAAIAAGKNQKALTLAISNDFATAIRPFIRVELGLRPEGKGWPSAGSIREGIKRVKNQNKTTRPVLALNKTIRPVLTT
jgi:hypothetical protein